MKYCSVKGCKSTDKSENKVLHTVKNEWIKFCEWKTQKPNRICSDHFKAGWALSTKRKIGPPPPPPPPDFCKKYLYEGIDLET